MKLFIPLLYISLLLGCLSAHAQQTVYLKGSILNDNDSSRVYAASVQLGKLKIKADSTGHFSMSTKPGRYFLRVTAVGFEPYQRNIDLLGYETELTINLKPHVNELDQVVVSGSRYEKKVAREVVSFNVVKPSLISNTNSNDLSDVVNRVPGVSVVEGQVTMRGGAGYSYNVGSRVIVLLDDMPLMGADLGDARWKLLPIEAAEQIEVVKGATSVLYGSAALNGSINVRTGWPGAKPETKITTFQGYFDNPKRSASIWWERTSQPFTSGAFFSHKQRFGNFDLIVSGNVNMTRSHLQLNDEHRARTFIKTRYTLPKLPQLSFGVNSLFMIEKAGRFFLWENADSGALKPYSGSAGQDFWRIYTIDPHATYTSKNKKQTHALKLRYYNITRFVDQSLNINLYDAVSQLYAMDYNYQQKFLKYFTSTAGFYTTRVTAVGNVYPGRYNGYSLAWYGQVDYQQKRWTVSAGLRYEVNRLDSIKADQRPLMKIGTNYQAAEKTFLRASYGEGYRFPTIGERYVQDKVAELVIFPNPSLKTEKGWTAELGLKQGFKIADWNAMFDYAFFWQEYIDLIEFRFGQYVPPSLEEPFGKIGFKALNLQQARTAGMEFSLSGEGAIGDVAVNMLAGYTYSYPVNLATDTAAKNVGTYLKDFFKSIGGIDSATAANKLLPYRNRHLVKTDIELTYKKIGLGYGLFYYSRFENIDPLLYVLIPQLDKFMARVGAGDWVHNIRISCHINPNVSVSFLVNNITNREYAIRPAKMDPPRSFNLQLRVRI